MSTFVEDAATAVLPSSTEEAATPRKEAKTGLIRALIARRRRRIGSLIDEAKKIPPDKLSAVGLGLAMNALSSDHRTPPQRRELVILLTIIARILIEIDHVPQDPSVFL